MAHRLSEASSRAMVEEAPDAIVLVDSAGVIAYVNTQAEYLFGYPRAALVGQRVEVLMPEDRRSMHVIQREVYQERPEKRPMGVGLDLVAQRADGSVFPAAISLSPIHDGDERMTIAVVRDITRRRREEETLRRSEARHRLLNERAVNVIFRYQLVPRRGFEYISSAVNGRLGHAPEEFYVDDDLIFRITHSDDRHVMEQALSAAAPRVVSLRLVTPEGDVRWFEFSIVPVRNPDGAAVALEGIGRDVTERRRADEERLRLEAEVEMQAERSRIAADLHDDTIQSLYALGLRLEAVRDDEGVGKTDVVDRAIQGLDSIISDLRRLLHQLSGDEDVDEVLSLEARIAALIDPHGPTSWEVRVDADLDLEPPVERHLQLLARELVSNVQRHAQASTARLLLGRDAVGQVQLTVRDNGVGFDRSAVGDDCLGLRSVEIRAEMLRAEVEFDSAPARGTVVRITLPQHATIAS